MTTAPSVLDETPRSMAQAAAELPGARGASHASRQRLVRWVSRGILLPDGTRVKLEAVRVGGVWVTSAEAVARFLARTSGGGESAPTRTPAEARRAARRAGAELIRRGC